MPSTEHFSYTMHDDVPFEEGRVVDEGLGEANDAAAPLHEVRRLSCFARAPSGAVAGGVVGRTWGACAEVRQLWVAPEHRRQGIGSRLVKEFERSAQARGCRVFYLENFNFQAPSLYRSLGYEVRLELRGFGAGAVKYTMVRESGINEPDA